MNENVWMAPDGRIYRTEYEAPDDWKEVCLELAKRDSDMRWKHGRDDKL
jgi:hypothetical protein